MGSRDREHGHSFPGGEVVLRRFESPDEVRTTTKGKFELVRIGGLTIGRAIDEPSVSLHFLGADHDAK